MPTVQRPPDPSPPVAARPDGGDVASPGPPEPLLRSSGPWALHDSVDPGCRLADAADMLARLVNQRGRQPGRWAAPAFAREVEVVRSQLRPICSRATLAASFGREAFHALGTDRDPAFTTAAQVAYAIRWLELGGAITWPGWRTVLGDPAEAATAG